MLHRLGTDFSDRGLLVASKSSAFHRVKHFLICASCADEIERSPLTFRSKLKNPKSRFGKMCLSA
jgi:hypothetical protein